ncbi:hypothetical protein CYY_003612 [Polysphondylium violaceum]|uniref:Uncharacterized protein n=1 Tax=Polysphondylium violaceum TaxID=133409 RepID=A0A8J4V5T3_9MYCE|nr:hypothetical protein CYY_003612 [Polysphondylium violaceum]
MDKSDKKNKQPIDNDKIKKEDIFSNIALADDDRLKVNAMFDKSIDPLTKYHFFITYIEETFLARIALDQFKKGYIKLRQKYVQLKENFKNLQSKYETDVKEKDQIINQQANEILLLKKQLSEQQQPRYR